MLVHHRLATTHGSVTHIFGTADKVRDWNLDLLQKIASVILEDRDIEHHDALHPLVVICVRHGLQATTAVTSRGHFRQVDISVLLGLASKSPVQRVAHILYLALATGTSSSWSAVGSDHVSVARNLDKHTLVLSGIQPASTVAPCNKRYTDVACWWCLWGEDGMAG
jgi:hypothetical protein